MNLQNYLTDLQINTVFVLDLISTYSTEELLFKNEGECSIADILEHICISDNRTIALLTSDSEHIADVAELYGDEKLQKIVVDYKGGPKITEAEIKELTGAVSDFEHFKNIFVRQRNLLQDGLATGAIAITNKTYKHLYLREMTVTDWLKYIIYHTNRHVNDVKGCAMEFKKLSPKQV